MDLPLILAFFSFVNWLDGANAFQPVIPPHLNSRRYLQPKTGSPSKSPPSLDIERPTSMPHQDFVHLTKEARRQLPHSKDKIIHVEDHPQLLVGFWQYRFKVPDHGAVHGLPYTVKENGSTQTEKSDDNTLAMIQSIVDMPHRPNVIWFDQDDVTYQVSRWNRLRISGSLHFR